MSSRISQKARKAVLARDKNSCRKCGRRELLELHHIKAYMDGGLDDLDNLVALCSACHDEWELVEATTRITFMPWLGLPPLGRLLIMMLKEWPEELSAKKYKECMLALLHRAKEAETIGVTRHELPKIQGRTNSHMQSMRAGGLLTGHIPFGFDAVYVFADGHEEHVTTKALRFGNPQKGINPDSVAAELMEIHGHVVDKKLVDNEPEQHWIRWMNERVTVDKWSFSAVAKALKHRGVTAKMGSPMGVGSVVSILRNTYTMKTLADRKTI